MILHELADRLRTGLASMSEMKDYINTARRAAYPDLAKFNKEQTHLENEGHYQLMLRSSIAQILLKKKQLNGNLLTTSVCSMSW